MKIILILLLSFNIFAQIHGTESRLEVETKLAFKSDEEINTTDITRQLRNELKKLLAIDEIILQDIQSTKTALKLFNISKNRNESNYLNEKDFVHSITDYQNNKSKNLVLKSEKYLSQKIRISEQVNSFVFEDTYFDTDNYELYNQNALYRLRYRFKTINSYKLYQILPLDPFYPIRCEIQSKVSSKQGQKFFSTNEARFEFRNESHPFHPQKNPAPPPPWKKDKYVKIAMEGIYNKQVISPMSQLRDNIQFTQLSPKVKLTTKRDRFHLYLPNPWGMGPNPSHIFIISLDHVEINCLTEDCIMRAPQKSFYEFEIEIDRNTYKNVIAWGEGLRDSEDPLEKRVSLKSIVFQEVLEDDLLLISKYLHNLIRKKLPLAKYDRPKSKYQRIFR